MSRSKKCSGIPERSGKTLKNCGKAVCSTGGQSVDTVQELADCLRTFTAEIPLPQEDGQWDLAEIVGGGAEAVAAFFLTWFPVAAAVLCFFRDLREYRFPVINRVCIALTIATLLPTWLTLLLPKIRSGRKWKKIARKVLFLLCALSIPVSAVMAIGIITRSETTDTANYRKLDEACIANKSDLFQALFPESPPVLEQNGQSDGSLDPVDAHYYYRYLPAWDYTYDIYAQWPLEPEEFQREVARAEALLEGHGWEKENKSGGPKYSTVEKGNYTCLVVYWGSEPFEEVDDSYTYCIFAYDAQSCTVRYIYCDSLEDGYDQPWYLTLEWE